MKDSNRKSFWDFADKHPDIAYMMGQLKIEGSLGLAMVLKERLADE